MREKEIKGRSGWLMLILLVALLILSIYSLVAAIQAEAGYLALGWIVLLVVDLGCLCGFTVINPNEAKVIQLFGMYKGSIKQPGLWWVNPLTRRRRVSLRIRNFESSKLKVNDQDGNPIEIAAVVVWKVVETAEAIFCVDDYEHFVHVQSESAVRNLATTYPYDAHEEAQVSLRGSTAVVAKDLKSELHERLAKAGVEVIEARLSHLAYAAEIAAAMLQRQQAGAIIAARTRIVEGAVGMVEMALERLSSQKIVTLDEDRKAAMVSNLLVVLCGERAAQPVLNTGTIYQ